MSRDLTCAECRERLPEYIAGTLAPSEAPSVRRHLTTCADCRREAEQWRAISVALAARDSANPPDTDALGGWLALRSQLARQAPIQSYPLSEVHRMEGMEDETVAVSARETLNAASGSPARGRRMDPRPFFALVAATLLIALSATLFGVYGAQLRRHPAAKASATPAPTACAADAMSAALPTYASVASVSMASALDGWAVGDVYSLAQGATAPRPLMAHFQNCRWTDVSAAGLAGISSAQLFSVAMDSTTDGWAVGAYLKNDANGPATPSWVGDKLLVLHDVGGQWAQVDVPITGDSVIGAKIVMTTPSEGWMLVDEGKSHTGPYTAVYAYQLFHYLNGAWNPVPLAFDTSRTLILWSIAATPGACWVAGYGTAAGDQFAVARYAGGKWETWTSQQVSSGTTTLYGIALTGKDNVWVVGSYSYHDANGDHDGSLVSHYQVSSWTRQQLSDPPQPQLQIGDSTLMNVAMASPAEGWAFPGAQIVFPNVAGSALHDVGGQWRWETFPQPILGVSALSFFSPTQGFGVAYTSTNIESAASEQMALGQLVYYDNDTWTLVPAR